MKARRLITLDANVLIAAIKEDEPFSQACLEIVKRVPEDFVLTEPSIIYQEVCGTLARRVDLQTARIAEELLNKMIHPALLVSCNKLFCLSAYPLCKEYEIYSVDALYLRVALDKNAILVSLDKEDFVDRVREKNPPIEIYHVSDFPY